MRRKTFFLVSAVLLFLSTAILAQSLNGETVFKKVFGLADLEFNIPNTPQTIVFAGNFSIDSVSRWKMNY